MESNEKRIVVLNFLMGSDEWEEIALLNKNAMTTKTLTDRNQKDVITSIKKETIELFDNDVMSLDKNAMSLDKSDKFLETYFRVN